MTDPKAAAERIVKYTSADSGSQSDEDAYAVARAYLALHADKGAEETARELLLCCGSCAEGGHLPGCAQYLAPTIAAALTATAAAAEARERERCAKIACDECSIEAPTEVERAVGDRIAAAIRGGDNG